MKKSRLILIFLFSILLVTCFAFGCGNGEGFSSKENAAFISASNSENSQETYQETEGLEYELNEDNQSYSVVGIGTATDTNIVIPKTYNNLPVTSIGYCAFFENNSLTTVIISSSVKSIDIGAFFACKSLTSITIGESLEDIGDMAFADCDSLTSIVVSENNQYYSAADGVLFNKNKTKLIEYPLRKRNIRYEIPNSVTEICDFAFADNPFLVSLTIGENVEIIGDYAFSGCCRLVEIYNITNVTLTGQHYGKSEAGTCVLVEHTDITTPSKVSVDANGFIIYKKGAEKILVGYCGSATEIVIPDGVTQINQYAFYRMDTITKVTIIDTVTSIGRKAFRFCDLLADITFKNTSGWFFTDGHGKSEIDVTNSETNATNLMDTYYDYYWKRNV